VVIGSLAATRPDDVTAWLERFGPEHITLALDVKIEDGVPVPALKGWTQSSGVTLWEALDRYPKGAAKHLLVTDVGRDGALTGPNVELLAQIRLRRPDLVLQASGGVSSLEDLAAVKALGCNGAIVGRALYENRFTLPEAIATASAA
jgi:phosphoribosylformimino-5-aminoimidazole carboxamide ribotide isomerase